MNTDMSDDTVQQKFEAVIRRDGHGEIRQAGATERVVERDADALRATIMQRMLEAAATESQTVRLRLTDVDGEYLLLVAPDGDIAVVDDVPDDDDDLADDDDLDDDDGGFHDEGLDDEFDADDLASDGDVTGLDDDPDFDEVDDDHDEPIDGDFEVPVHHDDDHQDDDHDDHDEPIDGDFEVPVDAASRPAPADAHDGGYAAMFGLTGDEIDTDDTVDLHETIQLPRPGMMRDEPPAVTGLQPIIPPSGSATSGAAPATPAAAPAAPPTARPAGLPPMPAPASPLGGDAYGAGSRVAPEWTPPFPRVERDVQNATRTPDDSRESDESHTQEAPQEPAAASDAAGAVPPFEAEASGSSAPRSARAASATPNGWLAAADDEATATPTLDDFLADRLPKKRLPASKGWRAGLRRTTGGLVSLGPGARERAEREEIEAISRVFDGPKTIVVVNPKGGAHKTTTTLMVAAMFGMHRGGYTLAWDNNETRGTLGWRSHRANHERTAVDLLRRLPHFAISGGATIADIDQFVRNQGEAMFDVLASDDDAASAAIIDDDAFSRLHTMLSRFYRVLVIDTGNNMRASNWEAALDVADQLVIVSTAREDTAASAAWLADGLRERGHEQKLANAVTVLSSPSAKEDPQLTARLRDHFSQLTRAVVEVPYDEAFVGGGELDVAMLRPETREAWRRVAAVIARGL